MNRTARLLAALLMLSGLTFSVFSPVGAEAPPPGLSTTEAPKPGYGDSVFLPIVGDGTVVHTQNVGTLDARFRITYEFGEPVDSGWTKPGSSWTFMPKAGNTKTNPATGETTGSARVEVIGAAAQDQNPVQCGNGQVDPSGGATPSPCPVAFAVSVDRSRVGAGSGVPGGNASYTGLGTALLPVQEASGGFWVYAPVVHKNYHGWNSVLHLQNVQDAPTQVSIWFYDENGNIAGAESNLQLRPVDSAGASMAFDPAASASNVPDGTYSAWIRVSGQADPGTGSGIAVVVDEFKDGLALSYRASPRRNAATGDIHAEARSGQIANFAPLVFKAYNSWNAGIRVLNTDPQSHAQVKVSFRDTAGTVVYTFEADIDRQSFKDYFFQDFSDLPQNFIGSATIESLDYSYPGASGARPIISVVQQVKWTVPDNDAVQSPQAMAYNTINFDEGARVIAAPAMTKDVDGWSTGLEIMNMNRLSGTGVIHTNFFDTAGRVWTTDSSLGPFMTSGRQYDLRFVSAIPGGFLGSAVAWVDSSVSQDLLPSICGIVNEVAVSGKLSDGGKSFEAFPLDYGTWPPAGNPG